MNWSVSIGRRGKWWYRISTYLILASSPAPQLLCAWDAIAQMKTLLQTTVLNILSKIQPYSKLNISVNNLSIFTNLSLGMLSRDCTKSASRCSISSLPKSLLDTGRDRIARLQTKWTDGDIDLRDSLCDFRWGSPARWRRASLFLVHLCRTLPGLR